MALDIQKFLTEIGTGLLSDEERTTALSLFEKHPELGTRIESQIVAGQTELQRQAAALKDKQDRIDLEWETLSNLRSGDDAAIKAAEDRLEALSIEKLKLENRFRQVLKDAGQDPDAVLKEIAVTPSPAQAAKVDSPASGFDPKQFEVTTSQRIWNGLTSALEVADLADEHQALFGTPLKRTELLNKLSEEVKRTGNPNLTIRDVWAKEYHVQDKLAEQAEAKVQQRIAEAVAEHDRKRIDAEALRGDRQFTPDVPIQRSPVLETLAAANKDQDTAAARVNGVPDGVRASILAFRKLRGEAAAKTA